MGDADMYGKDIPPSAEGEEEEDDRDSEEDDGDDGDDSFGTLPLGPSFKELRQAASSPPAPRVDDGFNGTGLSEAELRRHLSTLLKKQEANWEPRDEDINEYVDSLDPPGSPEIQPYLAGVPMAELKEEAKAQKIPISRARHNMAQKAYKSALAKKIRGQYLVDVKNESFQHLVEAVKDSRRKSGGKRPSLADFDDFVIKRPRVSLTTSFYSNLFKVHLCICPKKIFI